MRPRIANIFILLAMTSGLTAVEARAAANLVRNGGFEEGPGAYPGVGKYWETNDAQTHADINVLAADTRHSGGFSQWLKAHPQWDLGAARQVTPYNSVTAGKTYRVQAWIKTANVGNPAGWYVLGIWWFHGDTYLSDSKMPRQETNNYDWRLITWTAVAPPGADRLAVLLTRHTDGDAWYDDIFVAEELPGPPQIACTPMSFAHKLRRGAAPADDVLTVSNVGGGALNYTITVDAGWLSVVPNSGTSFGEQDACAIRYALGGLPVGVHHATIAVADAAADNSPRTLPVTITLCVPGDFDLDGDVDQEDFGVFQSCYSGSGQPQTAPACADARMDADDDVDLDDFLLWQNCMSRPDALADPACVP